jgi:hypothetical protein
LTEGQHSGIAQITVADNGKSFEKLGVQRKLILVFLLLKARIR